MSVVQAPCIGVIWPQHVREDTGQGEPRVRRLCVAPTLWQCALSLKSDVVGEPENLLMRYAYRLRARRLSRPYSVADSDGTQEQWITWGALLRNGGLIRLRYVRRVTFSLNGLARVERLRRNTKPLSDEDAWKPDEDGDLSLLEEPSRHFSF